MTHHILIFDSGLGGFTVLQEIQSLLPATCYSYLVDNGAFPYGDKSDALLIDRAKKLFSRVLPIAKPDIVVIACNTASTLFLSELRRQFSTPMIGVVPAIKPAAKISKNKKIGLLATRATISREYIDKLHAEHAADCKLFRFDCQSLVALAEKHLLNEAIDPDSLDTLVKEILSTEEAHEVDTMILGCTHFPALKSALAKQWPKPINWIDSGNAIARRAKTLCQQIEAGESQEQGVLYHTHVCEKEKMLKSLRTFNISKTVPIQI